ncbi:glycosyltransferase family 4 protein [Cellulomonas phragmiteti]|uniref:glycosyltransferase family 4 protein n=1 Tax=Cellulomonas phragmiteti TaxID=478780 RepID=UPI001EF3C47A|nr:glycosyltransferase family 1 protein [Cellulomonas phragmiteti]
MDATAVPPDRGGVGRYLDDLLPELPGGDIDLVVVAQQRDVVQLRARLVGARVVAAPSAVASRPVRLAWEQLALPVLARRVRADVLHSPHYTMPLLTRRPVVVTLHDATFFSHPELHSPLKARFFRTWIRVAARRAAVLVVPSQATRDEVVRFTATDGDAIVVAPHGVDGAAFRQVDAQEQTRVARSLGLEGRRWVAFLGTLEPRKNVPALVRAWVRACAGTEDPPALVLAGGRGWDTEVDPAVAEVPAGLTVLRPGYLPFEDLAGYLSGAAVVAYPSKGEGFGLPVLEAMACGAAVLTTRELSLTEVGGDAVAYCDVDVDSIAAALEALLADDAERHRLSAAARARAATFTWAASAARHAESYRRAARH